MPVRERGDDKANGAERPGNRARNAPLRVLGNNYLPVKTRRPAGLPDWQPGGTVTSICDATPGYCRWCHILPRASTSPMIVALWASNQGSKRCMSTMRLQLQSVLNSVVGTG